jgi:hypothetical protein
MSDRELHTDDLTGRPAADDPGPSERDDPTGSTATATREPEAERSRGDTPTAVTHHDALGWDDLLGDTSDLSREWDRIQAGFVDEPRRAVEQADALVAQVIQRLATSFSEERSQSESQWSRGDEVDTEDLRMSLRRYRSFFNLLLTH